MKIHLTWTQSKVLLFSFHRPDVAHHQLELISEEVLEFAGPREDLIQASKGATREACALPPARNCLRCRLLISDSPATPTQSQGSCAALFSPFLPVPTYRPVGGWLNSPDLVPARKWERITNKGEGTCYKNWEPASCCMFLWLIHAHTLSNEVAVSFHFSFVALQLFHWVVGNILQVICAASAAWSFWPVQEALLV